MRVLLIYFITIFLSNTVGALSGMGGGVIIKPVLDFLGFHSLNSIAFYSSVAVLSCPFLRLINSIKMVSKLNGKAASISFGSLVGGMLGDLLLNQAIALAPNEEKVQLIQYIIMLLTLVLVLLQSIFQLALTPQRIEHFSDCRIRLRDSINLFRHRWRSH